MATQFGAIVSALLKIAESIRSLAQASSGSSTDTSGWISYSSVIPTRASADDPTYVLTFSGVDLTSKMSVGMRVKFLQNSVTLYGIVTAISFSMNTTLTLYCGTDYDVLDTATYAISGFAYSSHKAPLGFPMDPSKWMQSYLGSTSFNKSSSIVAGTWYNNGDLIAIPIGAWRVFYEDSFGGQRGSADYLVVKQTLSTTNASESDSEFTSVIDLGLATLDYRQVVHVEKVLILSSKSTYYLNIKTDRTSFSNLYIIAPIRIKAVCAYL